VDHALGGQQYSTIASTHAQSLKVVWPRSKQPRNPVARPMAWQAKRSKSAATAPVHVRARPRREPGDAVPASPPRSAASS